jgi:hypothetical protein
MPKLLRLLDQHQWAIVVAYMLIVTILFVT